MLLEFPLFGVPPYKCERSEPARIRNSGDCKAGYLGEIVFCKVSDRQQTQCRTT